MRLVSLLLSFRASTPVRLGRVISSYCLVRDVSTSLDMTVSRKFLDQVVPQSSATAFFVGQAFPPAAANAAVTVAPPRKSRCDRSIVWRFGSLALNLFSRSEQRCDRSRLPGKVYRPAK